MRIKPLDTAPIGRRIRHLRETKGLSRAALARKIEVDVSSIAGWESGKRLPRDAVRARLADALDCELSELLSPLKETVEPSTVTLLDVSKDFPALFADSARSVRHTIRTMRLASPYSTTINVQTEARQIIGERLIAGTLEVQVLEIFYTLDRLKESLSNILRYDGRPYYVKACCVGMKEIAPFLGGFGFDDADVFVGGYWSGYPPQNHPVLRLRGPAIKTFYKSYWKEAWQRGAMLNAHGGHDLSVVRETALAMGLPSRQWKHFVDEARSLDIGDGAPPNL
jgi:transcriptional regulator with XRE-family HTH domain